MPRAVRPARAAVLKKLDNTTAAVLERLPDSPPDLAAFEAAGLTGENMEILAPPPGGWEPLKPGAQLDVEIIRAMRDSFPPQRIVAMMEQMANACIATRYRGLQPDYKTRMDFLRLCMAYGVGIPGAITPPPPDPPKGETESEGMARILTSAAARRILAEELRQAEELAAGAPVEEGK